MGRVGRTALVAALAFGAGCVSTIKDDTPDRANDEASAGPTAHVRSFSGHPPGDVLPSGWQPWNFSVFKRDTAYRLVDDRGTVVVRAHAQSSASGLIHPLALDPRTHPLLSWRWKTNALLAKADNTVRNLDDAPLRLLVTFDGNIEALPLDERLFAATARVLTGHAMPYATLVYIWENRAPRDSVIPNHHTSRVKMIVAESGRAKLGRWQDVTRNVIDDYQRAFGEAPGRITAVGIMTDTDNTGDNAYAWYGDIGFRRSLPPQAAPAP